MAYDNDTIRLIRFEAINAPEDSDATITLVWQVANAEQVTIEGPGVGAAGLNRRTIHTGAGQLHIKTSETKASYTLTAAPDPKRLINGRYDYDVNGKPEEKTTGAAKKPGEPEVLGADETGITKLGFKGVKVNKNICYVDHNSTQTLEWAFQNADEASFAVVKGEVPGVPEGNLKAEGEAKVGPFSDVSGAVLELKLSKPKSVVKKLDIRIKRAQITVTNDNVTPGSEATLSWAVENAEAIEITAFNGTEVAALANPGLSCSMSYEVEAGKTYQFKVDATSADGRRSHKIMSATVA